MQFEVQSLTTYPLKSGPGISLSQVPVTALGLEGDRHWMLVTHDNRYLSQRQMPALVQLSIEFTEDSAGILVRHPKQTSPFSINFDWDLGLEPEALTVTMHKRGDSLEQIHVLDCGQDAARWFTEALGPYDNQPIRLVAVDSSVGRKIKSEHIGDRTVETHLADGYPYLIASTEDLSLVNSELANLGHFPLEMRRFRPNIVFSGGDPWDLMQGGILAGDDSSIEFELVKPCARCIIIRTNQETGERDASAELIKSVLPEINKEKLQQSAALFGQNALLTGQPGTLQLGDKFNFESS